MPRLRQTGERKLSHSRSTTKKSVEMTDALGLHDVARECKIPSVIRFAWAAWFLGSSVVPSVG